MGDSFPPDHSPVDAAQGRLDESVPLFQHVDPAIRPQRVHIVGTHRATLQEMVNGQWVDVRPLKIRKEDGKYVVVLSEDGEHEPL